MQVPGEHASCGPRLEPSGFTYDPKDFMDAGVFFYNFGWKDYHEASMANILDMVKVLSFALSEGKVSGGQTGVTEGRGEAQVSSQSVPFPACLPAARNRFLPNNFTLAPSGRGKCSLGTLPCL